MNVIWIESDTIRRNDVGAYGNNKIRTSSIDTLAAKSDLITGVRAVGAGRYFPPAFAYVSAHWKEGASQ